MKNFKTKIATHNIILTSSLQMEKPVHSPPIQRHMPFEQKDKHESDHEMNGLAKRVDYERQIRLSNICLIMIVFQVVLCFTYYEFDHMENRKPQILLAWAYGLHCLLIILRLFIESIRFQRMPMIDKLDYSFSWQILKILLSFPLYPLPWLQNTTTQVKYSLKSGQQVTYPFKINYLIIIISILHSAIIAIRTLIMNTVYYSPRAQRIGKIYQIRHHGALYAVKCIIKDHPISAFALISCMMWIFSTFILKIAQSDVPIDGNKFIYYENCFWFIGITFASVGYGDIYPVSTLGHIVVGIFCIWSTFNTSVITVLLVTNLSLNQHENKSLQLLKNVDKKLTIKRISGQYIRKVVCRLWLNKKYRLNYAQSLQEKKLKVELNSMRIAKKKCINVNDLTQQMQNEFDNALINVENLHRNNKKLLDYISNKYILFDSKKDMANQSKESLTSANTREEERIISIDSILKNNSQEDRSNKSIYIIKKQTKRNKVSNQLPPKQRTSTFNNQSLILSKEKSCSINLQKLCY